MQKDGRRHAALAFAAIISIVAAFAWPPLPQPLSYHRMADVREWVGIPNALNVLSNLPFAFVGAVGLAAVFGRRARETNVLPHAWERWPYAVLFAGVFLTTFGSAWYHLAPDNGRLVWDRLPMTLGFMGLLTAVVGEYVSLHAARLLFVPLVATGAASVAYWHWTELRGAGDLRLYLLVQFGSLLLVLLVLALYRSRYGGTGYLVAGLATYAAAKALESADAAILSLGHVVSGHTLKHFAAAAGVWFLVSMLRARQLKQSAVSDRAHATT